ncbi:MAG: L-serine ammonia-lyase, iron-sulfur-dependent, subunit alpha [Eubacteriales bacterium]|nr:L-serine ammonia-lyase, iron-sulfur-dependent, subunit alpha [Eubacteriales bacterium]
MQFTKVEELLDLCAKHNLPVWEVMIAQEIELTERSRQEILDDMSEKVEVMYASIEQGEAGVQSYSGISGGDALRMRTYIDEGRGLAGDFLLEAVAAALAVNEVNASMGIICATPTAGSAGVVPGVLYSSSRKLNLAREDQVNFLLTAGAFGLCIGNQAPIAGATGGCQAEVGSASAMAAAALVAAAGGSPQMSAHALAMALKNILGLVCDPVAGLVEVPCIKRNALGVANAISAAEMALAGITSHIPADQVIETMGRVGRIMPAAHRETALGGLATTPAGLAIAEKLNAQKADLIEER